MKEVITMKQSKKEIYAAHGIEYVDGKVNSPIGLVSLPMIDGNDKIGKGVWHFSTLPGTREYTVTINGKEYKTAGTCVCDCIGCYAMTGNYRFPKTINNIGIRNVLARDYIGWLENAISAQIQAEKIQFIRIHASGDFFSMEYALMWKRIAIAFPGVTFWTYTKNAACESLFDGIENANIVKSVIPGVGLNFGHCDYILACYEYLKAAGKTVYICRCGIDNNQHCTNCKGCSKNEFVLFLEHSTAYKAEKDPLFPVIRALIESQAQQ